MAVEEVVPGVFGIPLGIVNAFAIRGQELALVDAGYSVTRGRLKRALSDLGGAASVRAIAVTHHHIDHRGGLSSIAETSGAAVWAHPDDAGVIRRDVPPPQPETRWAVDRVAVWAMMRLPDPPAARVEHEVADGEELPIGDGLIAYHTPGHTAGHLSFLMPSKRVLFVGDAAANLAGRLGPPFGLFSEDHAAVKRSIGKLAALDFDVACFGHGRPLKGKAAAEFRRLAEKLAG